MKRRWHVLAVDDESLNLAIIRGALADPHIDLATATSAEEAFALLESAKPFDLGIFDRMMPGMSGIDLLRQMKADPRYRHIPVIMQTAATAPSEVREGIEAGAYYYLTKPYVPEALVAIVHAALADVEERRAAARRVAEHAETLRMVECAEFRFRTTDEAVRLAGLLAALTPAPELVAMGLSELMINAVEHGNLGITYDEKAELRRSDTWEAEIARRLGLPEHAGKVASVRLDRRADHLVFTVRDCGAGFDWERFLDIEPERAGDPNGRGIAMARMLSFADLEYRGMGNEVVATVGAAPP